MIGVSSFTAYAPLVHSLAVPAAIVGAYVALCLVAFMFANRKRNR